MFLVASCMLFSTLRALLTRWGADYLLKCISYGPTGNISGLVYQVGNQTTDSLFWGRPEDITMKRPYYLADPDKMSDLGGATVGALASAAMVWRKADYGYYQRLMAAAAQLYDASLRTLGRCVPLTFTFSIS